jgi:hypothetical protein
MTEGRGQRAAESGMQKGRAVEGVSYMSGFGRFKSFR